MAPLFFVIFGALAIAAVVLLCIYVLVPLLGLLGKLIARVFTFIGGEISDSLRIVGAVITSIVLLPMALGSVVIGRWSASTHYAGAVRDEIAAVFSCVYRIAIGRPAWFLGLSALTEGIENRVPEVVARAPGSDKPSKRSGSFEGYSVVGSLPPGGSGAKLYIADPDERKRAAFDALGKHGVDQVIIKSFNIHDGSSLPQIVRESRALEAAKNIGLVLEHDLNEQRFYYVMPYIPGEDLSSAIRRLHETSAGGGLDSDKLRQGVTYAKDLAETLARYHRGGLWHKDIKPDNIIVHEGRAHLVDLGLVTPLRSAMTLTTHGTEYFRDPELVRMALRGVKVHQVSGEKFDVYAAGAVLYAIVENSFPAHGGLSQITKRCPESLRWVVRRAMAEYDKRYASAGEMLADLNVILAADDPYAVTPAELPSMTGAAQPFEPETPVDEMASFTPPPRQAAPEATPAAHVADPSPQPAPQRDADVDDAPPSRPRPRLSLLNWWTGSYSASGQDTPREKKEPWVQVGVHVATPGTVKETFQNIADELSDTMNDAGDAIADAVPRRSPRVKPIAPPLPLERRDSADEQLRRAKERVKARRAAANKRMHRRRGRTSRYSGSGAGKAFGAFAAVFAVMIAGGLIVKAVTEGAGSGIGNNSSVELTHLDDEGVSFFADTDTGIFRMIEADGSRYEISINPDMVREAARTWPERAGQWREMMMNRVVPAVLAAQEFEEDAVLVTEPTGGFLGLTSPQRWLVLDHLGAGLGSADRDRVNDMLGMIEESGITLVTSRDDEGLELVSEATATIRTGTPADPQTISRLRGFLKDAQTLDGLLWLVDDDGPRAIALSSDRQAENRIKQIIRRTR